MENDAFGLVFQLRNVAGTLLFGRQRGFDFADYCVQLILIDRLGQIVADTAADGFLRVFEVGVSA